MMNTPAHQVLDNRRSFRFFIDDDIIDTYGAILGPYGIAVYVYLARRAKNAECFPSHKTVATHLGMSRDSVIRSLKKLEEVGLISITPRTTSAGDKDTNIYTLLPLQHDGGSSCEQQPRSCEQQGVVAVSDNGSSCERHRRDLILRDLNKKEKKDILSGNAPMDRKGRKPPTSAELDRHCEEVLGYLNQATNRRYTATGHIRTLLKNRNVTVGECFMVIDWLKEVKYKRDPAFWGQYFDNVTPFRPANFDKYLAQAVEWIEQAQQTTPSVVGEKTQALFAYFEQKGTHRGPVESKS